MIQTNNIEEAINAKNIPPGSRIYCAGNASTPQIFLNQIAADESIRDIEILGVLLLGEIESIFSEKVCQRISHRIIFNGPHSRSVVNTDRASYQLMHLSDIPHQLRNYLHPDVVLLTVSGPDQGGNYSYGTTVEGIKAAVDTVREKGGLVIAERNARMPFVLGTCLHENQIDYLVDTDYPLPSSPAHQPDERARRIGKIIAELYIQDGSTLQYGIGEVPEAVTDFIIEKGVKDLGIHTELFADAMRRLIEKDIVTNRFLDHNFSVATIFLAKEKAGYDWLHYNSSVQNRPSDFTNSILKIASQPKMTAINSAIGVDLHGNIWADSLNARNIYSGIGGQADFLRGSYLSEGGCPVIAMKSTTSQGISKIVGLCPEGITTTAIAADPVYIVTEYGAFNPRGLNLSEHSVGIAHLAEPATREKLLRTIYDSKTFHTPKQALKDVSPKGFTAYEDI
ncbi:MAG: acetyl-CoA hydrolase/transferase C-terminal domain-containing protein [Bacteroidota bacterium]|nr:acetyl-CoA hydrolase/transferase C-terminal domain-containing protein [Bacteroidota bacterium]